MIVKFLYSKGSTANFPGVGYNTTKMEKGRGELMHVANFGALQGLTNLRPNDYKNYLKLISTQSKRIEKPQLHVAISCKQKEFNKHQLTEIGKQWLKEMGYGDQPYLIVFHKDTDNNHVHLVSTRIDKELGVKINSDFEKLRAMTVINRIIGLDEKLKVVDDVSKSLAFSFKTKAQFSLLMEKMGYDVKSSSEGLVLMKFGKVLHTVPTKEIEDVINNTKIDTKRTGQLRGIIERYKTEHSPAIVPNFVTLPSGFQKQEGYTSDLAKHLKSILGVEMVFHYKDDKPPYGYSILDYGEKNVFKGGDVINIKDLIDVKVTPETEKKAKPNPYKIHLNNVVSSTDELAYYKTLVHSVINSYGTLDEGLKHQGFDLIKKSDDLYIIDINAQCSIKLDDLIQSNTQDYSKFDSLAGEDIDTGHSAFDEFTSMGFSSNDIDDEAINGRNRKKKGMARTNTR